MFFSCLAASVLDHVDNLILVLDVGVLDELDELIPVRTKALDIEVKVLRIELHFLQLILERGFSSLGTVIGKVVVELILTFR